MARSDYLFGYDPREKEPWLNYVPEQIKSRVSKQPQRKRSTWIARGNIRAAHAGRRAKRLDEQQQIQQQMGARQNALMESRMPLDERKFRQSQIEYGQGRQDKFGMQQAGFENTRDVAQMGIDARTFAADIANKRGVENTIATEGRGVTRDIASEGRAVSRADKLRPIEMQEKKDIYDYQQQNQRYAPQYQAVEGPTGEQSFIEKGVGSIGEGNKLTSPSQSITMNQPKSPPIKALDDLSSLYSLQSKTEALSELVIQPGPDGKPMLTDVAGELGPMATKWEEFKEKWAIPFAARPTSQGMMLRQISSSINNYLLNLLSGAAINKDEFLRLIKETPHPDMQPDAFVSRLNGFAYSLKEIISFKQSVLGQLNYTVPTRQDGDNQDVSGMTQEQLIQAYKKMRGQ